MGHTFYNRLQFNQQALLAASKQTASLTELSRVFPPWESLQTPVVGGVLLHAGMAPLSPCSSLWVMTRLHAPC